MRSIGVFEGEMVSLDGQDLTPFVRSLDVGAESEVSGVEIFGVGEVERDLRSVLSAEQIARMFPSVFGGLKVGDVVDFSFFGRPDVRCRLVSVDRSAPLSPVYAFEPIEAGS